MLLHNQSYCRRIVLFYLIQNFMKFKNCILCYCLLKYKFLFSFNKKTPSLLTCKICHKKCIFTLKIDLMQLERFLIHITLCLSDSEKVSNEEDVILGTAVLFISTSYVPHHYSSHCLSPVQEVH